MIFKRKNLALLIVFLAFHPFLDAQVSQTIDGLSSNYIESVKSDNLGIIWIGTNEGLNALIDGRVYEYQSYRDTTALLDTEVNDIYVTDKNTVFFLSNSGLSIFQRFQNDFLQIKTVTKPISLFEDPYSNDIYLATENSGIIVLNNDLKISQTYKLDVFDPFTLSTNNLSSLLDNRGIYFEQDKIWVATDRGLNIINRVDSSVSRRLENAEGSLSSNVINGFSSLKTASSISGAGVNYILIGTNTGLDIYDKINNKIINAEFDSSDVKNIIKINSNLFAMLVDSKPTLLEYDTINQKFESKTIVNEKNNSAFESIYQYENYLVATGEDYLYIFDEDFRVIFEKTTDYPISEVNIKENVLWVGTQNGLTKYNLKKSVINKLGESTYYSSNKFYEIQLKNNLFFVNDIINKNTYEIEVSEDFVNDNDRKIILKNNYLLALGNSTLHFYNLDFSFFALQFSYNFELEFNEKVHNMELNDESFYVTTDNATYEYESDLNNFSDFSFIFPKNEYFYDKLLNPEVPPNFTDIERIDNNLWISSEIKGISFHQITNLADTLQLNFKDDDSIMQGIARVNDLHYIKEQNMVYAGTYNNGLVMFDLHKNNVSSLSKKDGLLSNNISEIHYQDSTLFVKSAQGINLIKGKKIRSITEEDGLSFTFLNDNSIHKFDSTKLALSGSDGLYSFNYRDLYKNDPKHEIHLFKIIGFDKYNNSYPLKVIDNKLIIDNQTTSLLFEVFNGSHYKSENNKYYYSINNQDYNLSVNGYQISIPTISFPYYGSKLSLYMIDANGNRSLNEIEIAITNKPPFWFSYQALLLYIIALIGIYWLIQKRRVEKAKDEFEKERREKELNEARDLQQSLLPKITPATTNFDISTYLQSANEMGGDYFDFIEFEDKLYSICGDATGHGVTSGIMVSVTKAGLNGVELNSPSTMLGKLNTIVKKVNFGRIRMSLSVVKLEENSIEISSAAMPPYFIYSAKNKKLNEVLIPNLPLGGLSLTQYESNKHDFEVGDILVMMSDGLPELPNESNELLDYEAIYDEIFDNIDKSAKQISNALLGLGKKWRTHLDDLPDDITLVVIKKVA